MSPRSASTVGPVGDFSAVVMSARDGKEELIHAGGGFGIRKQQVENYRGGSSSPAVLKVSKEAHRIRKPPLPLPLVQYRPPIIIHTHSPKVRHTEPDDFMSLVQKLTGSSDTRLRLKKTKPSSKRENGAAADGGTRKENPESPETIGGARHSAAGASIQRQGSGFSSATSNCGSPSDSSGDSATVSVTDHHHPGSAGELATNMKQSNSPRSPFDSDFEFENHDNLSMFSHLEGPSPPGSTMFAQTVKAEPFFSFTENNSVSPFNNLFGADFMTHPGGAAQANNLKLPIISGRRPQVHPQDGMASYIDVNAHLPGYLSPYLVAGLPDLSSPAWSQSNYLDCLSTGPGTPGSHFIDQAPSYLRQRQFSPVGYSPSPEGTVLALENIHAFTLT